MKLTVKIAQNVAGDKMALSVCDEYGEPLPNQQRVELFNSIDDLVKVTVTFVIDDDLVKLVAAHNGE